MKHYTHKPVELKKLTTQTINFKRFYETPDGNLYPSITTVLSTRNKKGLFEWRKKVGDEVANYVARVSANRGTAVHHMCEDYLNNYPIDWPDKWKEHEKKFLPYCLFKQLKKTVLEKIDNIRSQECSLFSRKYRVAGRVDCIAEYALSEFFVDQRDRLLTSARTNSGPQGLHLPLRFCQIEGQLPKRNLWGRFSSVVLQR